jgi:hypothetical protein
MSQATENPGGARGAVLEWLESDTTRCPNSFYERGPAIITSEKPWDLRKLEGTEENLDVLAGTASAAAWIVALAATLPPVEDGEFIQLTFHTEDAGWEYGATPALRALIPMAGTEERTRIEATAQAYSRELAGLMGRAPTCRKAPGVPERDVLQILDKVDEMAPSVWGWWPVIRELHAVLLRRRDPGDELATKPISINVVQERLADLGVA